MTKVYSAYSSGLLLSSFDDQPRAMSTACINLKNYRISLVSNSLGGISYLALGFSFHNQWLLLGTISIHGRYASVQTFLFLITFKIGLWNKIICFYASFNIFLVLLSLLGVAISFSDNSYSEPVRQNLKVFLIWVSLIVNDILHLNFGNSIKYTIKYHHTQPHLSHLSHTSPNILPFQFHVLKTYDSSSSASVAHIFTEAWET